MPSAVPPHFTLSGALIPDRHPVAAVTGRTRAVLLSLGFLQQYSGRLQRCRPAETFTVHLLLYQCADRLLLLEVEEDYTFRNGRRQA